MLNKVHEILEINCVHEIQYYELYIFSQIQNEDLEKPPLYLSFGMWFKSKNS